MMGVFPSHSSREADYDLAQLEQLTALGDVRWGFTMSGSMDSMRSHSLASICFTRHLEASSMFMFS